MPTKRAGSKVAQTVTTTESADSRLDAVEEKVVRMTRGLTVKDDAPLAQLGDEYPELAARLRDMELRALEKSGRLRDLREEGASSNAKQKIIDGLRSKDPRRGH